MEEKKTKTVYQRAIATSKARNIRQNVAKGKQGKVQNQVARVVTTTIVKPNQNNNTQKNNKNANKENRSDPHTSDASYKNSLMWPELYFRNVKIPRQFGQPTISIHRHVSVPLTVDNTAGTGGNMHFFWYPNFLADDATNLNTLGASSALFNPVTGTGTAAYLRQQWNIPANNVASYRLVSAAIHVIPQSSNLNAQGKVTGAIILQTNTPPSASTSVYTLANIGNLTVLDNASTCSVANVAEQKGVRMIYCPIDNQDLALYPINTNECTELPLAVQPIFSVIMSGCPSGVGSTAALFTVELYANYEITPWPTSILQGLGSLATDFTDPLVVSASVQMHPENMSQVVGSNITFSIADQAKMFMMRNIKKTVKNGKRGRPSDYFQ